VRDSKGLRCARLYPPLVLGLLLLLAAPALAQTPPGTNIVNIATCEFLDPSGSTLPPGGMVHVPSNPVVTPVAPPLCFLSAPRLEVEPAGTVAPGDRLRYRLIASNDSGGALTNVVLRLPLDPGLTDPISFTDGSAPLAGGGTVPVGAAWDPLARTLTWILPSLGPGQTVSVRLDTRTLPSLPADTQIQLTGSCTADTCPAPVNSNLVLTAVIPPVLRTFKSADRSTAVPGDAVVYEVLVRHEGTAPDFTAVDVRDVLPPGFRYVEGSARLDGLPIGDPVIGPDGRSLSFAIGPLLPGEARTLQLAAIVTPRAEHGEAINRASATGATATGSPLGSTWASAAVKVTPGPFRREAYLVGRVFVDDDEDGLPGADEPGLPGVLVLMEDGRGAVTDVTGRWHIEGVRPGLHVLRLDPSTIPPGDLAPVIAGTDWAGDRNTRFIETRASALAVADFPLGPPDLPRCSFESGELRLALPGVSLFGPGGDLAPEAGAHLEKLADWFASNGARARGRPTVRCDGDREGAGPDTVEELSERLQRLIEARTHAPTETSPISIVELGEAAASGVEDVDPFHAVLRSGHSAPAILSPRDGQRLTRRSVTVDLLVPAGSDAWLEVNGTAVPRSRVGVTSTLPSKGLTAIRYVGVPLRTGSNVLALRARAADGTYRRVETTVTLPDAAVELRLDVPEGRWLADGITPGRVRVLAVDAAGVRASERPVVTLQVDGATPLTADLDAGEPGLQVRLDDGQALVRFAPVTVPGRVSVTAATERLEAETFVDVVPQSRSWTVVGLAEGRVAGDGGVEGDGGLAPDVEELISNDGGRLAVFARGPVGEASQLTVSIDSDRERDRDRLFQDFDPDRFYPVTGDASESLEEAPAQGEIFARVDGPRGFAQWGDFTTGFDRTELARYDRTLNGASGRVSAGNFSFEGFGASSEQRLARDILEPDGTSGPYLLERSPVVSRSETVIVETRDRHRSEKVLHREIKRRDLDYDLDPEAGTILFHAPVPPFDADLNPLRVVVLYESRVIDDEQLVGGGRVSFAPSAGLQVGASAIHEERDGDDLGLYGVDMEWRPKPGTVVRGELARSEETDSASAVRVEISSRPAPELSWELGYHDLDSGFANPSLLAGPELGSKRLGGSVLWEPDTHWRVLGETYRQEDERQDLERLVAGVDVERRFGKLAAFGGLKSVSSDSPTLGDVSSNLVKGGVRGRIGERWLAELSRDQVLGSDTAPGFPSRTSAMVGYDVRPGTRLFLRHELESGDGPERDRTLLGIESRLGARTKALSTYSLSDGANGSALRALTGVETVLPLSPRSSIRLSGARLDTVDGSTDGDYMTLGGGYEYHAGNSLLTSRYELRLGDRDDRHLLTAAGAYRPRESWTLFVRERLFLTDPEGSETSYRAEGLLGAAYRPLTGRWQFLSRLDHTTASGTTTTPGGVVAGSIQSEPAASASTAPGPTGPAGIGFAAGREASIASRDTHALSVALGTRLTARQRLAVSWIGRHVESDPDVGLPSTFTWLTSLHYTAEVHRRWTVGGSLRRFKQDRTNTETWGQGVEVGYLLLRNLWVTGGYNFTGFDDDDFPGTDRTNEGAFLSVRFKFDERSLTRWGDLRLDRD
jgi:uncharacterized repeat protein (TIGR01451 family)